MTKEVLIESIESPFCSSSGNASYWPISQLFGLFKAIDIVIRILLLLLLFRLLFVHACLYTVIKMCIQFHCYSYYINVNCNNCLVDVLQVLVPPLRELESYIFERLFRYLWQKALLESVSREPIGGPAMFSPHQMTPIHKASQHEDAIQRWLDALQVCKAVLHRPESHSQALKVTLTSLA